MWTAPRQIRLFTSLAARYDRPLTRGGCATEGRYVMTEFKLTRRLLGSAAAGGLVAAAAIGAARAQSARKTFVLVHGSFAGGWIWRRVADQLEQKGHKVFVPTLTGLGERSHLLRKDIDLDTHIADVVNVFK